MTHRKYKFPSPELRAAFPRTLPILMGYLFLGFAFGVLLGSRGYGALTSFLASTLVYAGSLQFVAVELLGQFNLLQAALVALMVNARHLFYGLSMLERFRGTGRYKPYLIFSLTDETYSLYCAGPVPPGLREDRFLFSLAWLDHLYWIAGSVLGSAASWLIPFETQGIEFVMTALFTVIFLGQWEGAAPPNGCPEGSYPCPPARADRGGGFPGLSAAFWAGCLPASGHGSDPADPHRAAVAAEKKGGVP